MKILLGLILVLGLVSEARAEVDNVYGKGQRKAVTEFKRPFNRIGRLEGPDSTYCTASLVGSNLILTAAHCIANEKHELMTGAYHFILPNGGGTAGVIKFWYGSLNAANTREQDWAILKLDAPLGTANGYFGTDDITDIQSQLNHHLMIAGYSSQFSDQYALTYEEGCSIRSLQADGKVGHHDCDAAPGDSGAPILSCVENNICQIVAIHVAAYQGGSGQALTLESFTEQFANISTSASNFSQAILQARQEQ